MKKFIISLVLMSVLFISLPVLSMSYCPQVAVIKDSDGYTNVRNGPGTGHKIISKVYEGEYFLVLRAEYQDWWIVQAPDGKIGYMNTNKIALLEPSLAARYYAYVNDPDGYTNVRKGPGSDYKVIGKVYENEIFIVLQDGGQGEWYRILTKNGTYGFMHSSRISPVPFTK